MTSVSPRTPKTLTELAPLITSGEGFADVVSALLSGHSAAIDGAWGSSCALTVAALQQSCPQHSFIVVVPGIRDVDGFADELSELRTSPVQAFAAWESLPAEHDISDSIFTSRLRVLGGLSSECSKESSAKKGVIVTCVPALLQPVPSRSAIQEGTWEISVKDELQLNSFSEWLIDRGFERVTAVELPGEFSLHGGILDIYSATEINPIRLELYGDEVESIRSFDVETQRRICEVESISITAVRPVTADVKTPLSDGRLLNNLPMATESLLDSLPRETIVVFIDLAQGITEGRLYLQRLSSPVGMFGVDATIARLIDFPSVTVDALAADSYETQCHLHIEAMESFSDAGKDALEELAASLGPADRVLLCCHNQGEHERLSELLVEQESKLELGNRITLCTGRISSGFRLLDHNLAVVSDNELFSRTQSRRVRLSRRTTDSRAIDSFLDLREGDLVVHVAQGIARYCGMSLMDNEGEKEEHLLLEFRDKLTVYVPASLIHLVQKYIGPAKTTPQLSKFGGAAWEKKKGKVASAVSDMASEMLKLQAERSSRPGLQCGTDSRMQEEFERAFPFTETPDQLTAVDDCRDDMEQLRPMDRLICGDVGFGKTEVAIRAAFKAVDNGRQVAVLVPTTVLAEQHLRTFSQRTAEFPVNVEMLSRYRSAAAQHKILAQLASGEIDIVVGTHRLVSRDVKFRDLGLLVIDEEQKFGVKVKDRLKHLRLEVDVLTLTATPIPRTLHMSLLGIRDISSLTTPPRDRMPIETRVGRFDEAMIRSAILRELNRGGQIYFVHNRVHDIQEMGKRVQRIVPEATLAIAHGQMHEHDLESAMISFVRGTTDILLATTIIESGLDIPNANTMIIHQADIYGLADLHQLRGRVGRDRHRAYCYLMLEEGKVVTTKAARRLKAIEEYSELGAGFRIAMRDLEIRGAGNILGTEQSGNIAAVGYELYCQLLENAVRAQKKQPLRYQMHVTIDLPVSSFIPDRYISEQSLKIEIYRRVSQENSLRCLSDLETELRDRFGPVPAPVRRMLRLRELNLRALSWKIENIHLEDGYAVLRYRDRKLIKMLSFFHRGHLRIVDHHDGYWPLECDVSDGSAVLEELLMVLSEAEPPIEESD